MSVEREQRNWIISGATGFIGRELVRRLLLASNDRMTLLVRDIDGGQMAAQRVDGLLSSLGIKHSNFRSRVAVIAADITDAGFGISLAERRQLIGQPSIVVHLAASTCFVASREAAWRSNVEGTRNMMALARALHSNGNLDTFAHVSTAFVAADRTGLTGPNELDMNAGFRNNYERSKAEAERMVRIAMDELPSVIFRPSIVVGSSITGEADGANTIYWGLKRYLRGQKYFFARRDATLDIVPVDYVVDAMLALLAHPDRHGKCFPLVAGAQKQVSLGEFAGRVSAYFERRPARILSPRLLQLYTNPLAQTIVGRLVRSPVKRRFINHALSYLPYFSSNPSFDGSITEAALRRSDIEVPHLESYLPTLLHYCERQGWARPLPRSKGPAFIAHAYDTIKRAIAAPALA